MILKALVFKAVKRICISCKKEYLDNCGCVLCNDCIERNKRINALLGK